MGSTQNNKTRQQVQEQAEFWRRQFEKAQKLRQEMLQGELSPDFWRLAWHTVCEQRQRARKYLIDEYGIEVQLPDWLSCMLSRELRRGATPQQILALRLAFGPPLVADSKRILERILEQRGFTKADTYKLRAASRTHTLYSGVRRIMAAAFEKILSAEDVNQWLKAEQPLPLETTRALPPETTRALNRAAVDILTNPHFVVGLAGAIMRWSPDREEVEAATTSLAGFVHNQLKDTNRARRRNRAVSKEEQLDALPASVRLAWHEWEEAGRPLEEPISFGTGKTSFVSRVDKMLEALGNEPDALDDPDRKRRDKNKPVKHPRKWVRKLEYLPTDVESLPTDKVPREEDADLAEPEPSSPAAETEHEAREEAARQLDALREECGMTLQQAAVWYMREHQGKGYDEIAARLEITRTHARVQYYNAKQLQR